MIGDVRAAVLLGEPNLKIILSECEGAADYVRGALDGAKRI